MKRTVRVVPYDKRWPDAFAIERDALSRFLGPAASAIHHIGSTSVPGLCAKPVIDILVETPGLVMIDQTTAELEARAYAAKGEHGIPGRRYFSRPPGPELMVHVHAFRVDDPHIARHLRFRDLLRSDEELVAQYCALKQQLAIDHVDDPDTYQASKADFIQRIHAVARHGSFPVEG